MLKPIQDCFAVRQFEDIFENVKKFIDFGAWQAERRIKRRKFKICDYFSLFQKEKTSRKRLKISDSYHLTNTQSLRSSLLLGKNLSRHNSLPVGYLEGSQLDQIKEEQEPDKSNIPEQTHSNWLFAFVCFLQKLALVFSNSSQL